MNPFKKYETDPVKERDGVPIEFDGMTFYCRRAGGANRAYRAACSTIIMENPSIRDRLQSEDTTLSDEAQSEIEMYAFVESVLLGWKDVEGRDGQPLEFTKDNARDLFTSCSEVWLVVRGRSMDRDTYRREQVEKVGAALGNSSDGIENTAQT